MKQWAAAAGCYNRKSLSFLRRIVFVVFVLLLEGSDARGPRGLRRWRRGIVDARDRNSILSDASNTRLDDDADGSIADDSRKDKQGRDGRRRLGKSNSGEIGRLGSLGSSSIGSSSNSIGSSSSLSSQETRRSFQLPTDSVYLFQRGRDTDEYLRTHPEGTKGNFNRSCLRKHSCIEGTVSLIFCARYCTRSPSP